MFKSVIAAAALALSFTSATVAAEIKIVQNEALNSLAPAAQERLITAVKAASSRWIDAFNSGNAAATAQYEADAVMTATPFGTFNGHEEIQPFWENLIAQGFDDVRYIETSLTVVDENTAIVASNWKMNKASGIITNETWAIQADGTAKLSVDEFAVPRVIPLEGVPLN